MNCLNIKISTAINVKNARIVIYYLKRNLKITIDVKSVIIANILLNSANTKIKHLKRFINRNRIVIGFYQKIINTGLHYANI